MVLSALVNAGSSGLILVSERERESREPVLSAIDQAASEEVAAR
jgi:hypothetical protein